MTDGFLFWYERDWTPRHAADRIGAMAAAGLSLTHHATGQVVVIGDDPVSAENRVPATRSQVTHGAALDTDPEFSFTYWPGLDVDVFCTISRVSPNVVVQRLYLDGLTTEQFLLVVGVVVDQIRAAPRTTVGLIVDRVGGSVAVDWDAVVAGAPGRVPVRANIMALPEPVSEAHPELSQGAPAHLGDLVLHDPERLLPEPGTAS